jgi:coenzyme F420-reducing hydrogenase delta subunit
LFSVSPSVDHNFVCFTFFPAGVEDVQADVETKIVNVTCEDSVENEILLSALKNWGDKAGKSVELMDA